MGPFGRLLEPLRYARYYYRAEIPHRASVAAARTVSSELVGAGSIISRSLLKETLELASYSHG
jgi:hypothetical protein